MRVPDFPEFVQDSMSSYSLNYSVIKVDLACFGFVVDVEANGKQ